MNKFKTKFISSALALASMASAAPAFAAIPHDVVGTRYEEPVQILSALKIMIGDDAGTFRPDDSIIRSEVAKIAVHALGLEDAAESMKGQSKFPDVSTDHWANGYINLASANGIVIGDDTGNFRPNDAITYAEAMTMFVRILGYEPQALQKGGFPNGYIQTGTANGLNKNVTGSANNPISRGNVSYMANNALTVNLMEQTNFGSNPTYEVTTKTLLADKLKIKKAEGQITAIESTSLSGSSSLKKGQIKINDQVYDTAYNMNNLLGYNVVYYIDTENYNTVILAMPVSGKNSSLTISADLFERVSVKNTKTVIEYYKDANASNLSTAEINTDAVMLYNGKKVDFNEALLDINGSSGNVTMLDTDKDGKYDKVYVTEYRNIFVNNVTSSGKITDKYGNPSIELNDDVRYRITRGLEELTVKDLNENDVLSVAESLDKELYSVEVSNDYVSGKITGTDSEGIFVNGEHFKLARNFKENIKVGDQHIFYLDIDGKIAGSDTATSAGTGYAYLIRAFHSTDDEVSKFRLFTVDDEEIVLESNEKIRFNGTSGQLSKNVVSTLSNSDGSTISQMVTYKSNDSGKLIELNTAIDKTATGVTTENSEFTMNFVINDAVFNKTLSKLDNIKVTANTIIFEIPEDSTDYAIRDLTMFENEQKYNIVAYDVQEDYSADVIMVTNSNLMPNADAAAAVVKSVATSVNADDEQTHLATILVNGREEKLLAEDMNVLKKENGSTLKAGDVIQYKTNSKAEITSIRLLFDIDAKNTEAKNTHATDLTTIYGKVQKKFTNSINVTVNNGVAENIIIPDDCQIYNIDTSKTKNNITTASKSDIYVYDSSDNNRVLVTSYKDNVKEIFIIK